VGPATPCGGVPGGLTPLASHLGLGKLYRHTDKRGQAREHLATATTMYREMGMTYWLETADGNGERRREAVSFNGARHSDVLVDAVRR
jgi:hypothetical protein